jgi:hypothetical protein
MSLGEGWFDTEVIANSSFDVEATQGGWWDQEFVSATENVPNTAKRRVIIIA